MFTSQPIAPKMDRKKVSSSFRAAKIVVSVYHLFLQLACLNSIFFRQNPFKLSEVSDSSKIAREPTPLGQENSYYRDIVG